MNTIFKKSTISLGATLLLLGSSTVMAERVTFDHKNNRVIHDHRVTKTAPPRRVQATRTRQTVTDHRRTRTSNTKRVPPKRINVQRQSKSASNLKFTISKSMKNKLRTLQWEMKAGSVGRPILSGNRYQLTNLLNGRGLKRQKRTIAANLGFGSSSKKSFNMLIKRQAGNGQVRYGDRVALNISPYGWLKYKNQSRGINISDDDHRPHYIWTVTGGTRGQKLVSGMPFALYNNTERAEVVYCKRTWGINLGWHGVSKCGGLAAKVSSKVFGENGLFARDGLSGKGFVKLKDFLCDKGVKAAAAYATAQSGGLAAPVALAAPRATKECKKL
ncbi:MAG: hypothetical protein V3U71_12785 [Cocleimonas sp.]